MSVSRNEILNAAVALLRAGRAVSLDGVANEVGLTKAGLLHHFRSKQDLMLGVVDHVAARWDAELRSALGNPLELTARQRIRGYAQLAVEQEHDEVDLALLADPRLRAAMTQRWVEHFAPWIELSDLPLGRERAALTAIRLIADGAWFNNAAHVFPVAHADRPLILAVIDSILERHHP